MPTYSYECKKCKHSFELFHGMNATPRVKCGECGGASMKMIGTGAGIIFKGSGFYETDFKKKSGTPDPAPAATTEAKESKSTEVKESKVTESKESKTASSSPATKTSTGSTKKKLEKSAAAKN